MEDRVSAADIAILDTADRVGRAAYLWLRQHQALSLSGLRGRQLAAGFIAELCDALELTERHSLHAAYTCALLQDKQADPLCIAEILSARHRDAETTAILEQGRVMAAAMLALIEGDSGDLMTAPRPHSPSRFSC